MEGLIMCVRVFVSMCVSGGGGGGGGGGGVCVCVCLSVFLFSFSIFYYLWSYLSNCRWSWVSVAAVSHICYGEVDENM